MGEQWNAYKITRLVCGKYSSNRNVPTGDKQRQRLTSEKEQEAQWVDQFEEVFNRRTPEEDLEILRTYANPSHLIKIIRSFYRNFTCPFGVGDILFEVKAGVRQGCVMSTAPYNLFVEWMMRRITARTGASDGLPSLTWKT